MSRHERKDNQVDISKRIKQLEARSEAPNATEHERATARVNAEKLQVGASPELREALGRKEKRRCPTCNRKLTIMETIYRIRWGECERCRRKSRKHKGK